MTNPLTIFHEPGDIIEIRVVGRFTSSGYFNDADKAWQAAQRFDGKANIYFVLNKVDPACYSRSNRDAIVEKATSTSDNDIARRRWVYIDFDPDRPTGVSATDEEKAKAYETMMRAGTYFKKRGFKAPIVADSGNGYHLIYRIDMPSTKDDRTIENFLKVVSMNFSDDNTKIDTTVFNPSRITKLYGTTAAKGANTEDRPHRKSGLIRVPDVVEITDSDAIKAIARELPKPAPRQTTGESFDLQSFMSRNRLTTLKTVSIPGGMRYILEECPFDSAHGKDSMIYQGSDGAIGFKCLHNGCANNKWEQLREKFEPGYKDARQNPPQQSQPPPRSTHTYKPEPKPSIVFPQPTDANAKTILNRAVSLDQVRKLDRADMKVFYTGLTTLDAKMEIVFGKLVVVSGTNGSGKSTFLGQIILESIEQGHNVFAYSGELIDSEFQYWIDLQAAGSKNLDRRESKSGKEYFDIKSEAKRKMQDWYRDRIFLYKNNESMQFSEILSTVEAFRMYRGCSVIVLDNFLTMDISDLDDKDLRAQTIFINSLARYAKEKNVLLFLVIHPKKIARWICTKSDVLGSGNLTNAIDYLFLVHRNNEAWKAAMKDRPFASPVKTLLLHADCTNIVEVSKDRWSGAEGLNVRLEYQNDSKRLVDLDHKEEQLSGKFGKEWSDRVYSWTKQ